MKKSTLLGLTASAAFALSSQAATVLIGGTTNNGDFEDPIGADSFASGNVTNWANWTEQSAVAGGDTGTVARASLFAYLKGGGAIVNMTTTTIAVGDTFNFGFTNVRGRDVDMQLVYNDGGVLTGIAGTEFGGDQYETYTSSLIVTAGDAWIGKVVGVGILAASNYPEVDDVTLSVSAVPEPSSAALLGLGGLALILRRRK